MTWIMVTPLLQWITPSAHLEMKKQTVAERICQMS